MMRLATCLTTATLAIGGLAGQTALAGSGDPVVGRQTAESWCSACHAVGEGGQASDTAPSFVSIASWRDAESIRAFLAFERHSPMPPLSLSEADIDNVVAYIHSLRPATP